MLHFVYFGDFSLRMRSFNYITTSSSQYDVIFKFSRARFPIKTPSFWAHDTILGDVCDDNVFACVVSTLSTLILLPVANFLPEMDSAITVFYRTRTFRL